MEPVSVIFIRDEDHRQVLRDMGIVVLDISGDPVEVASPELTSGGSNDETASQPHSTADGR